MPTQTDEAPPISSLSDDELIELAKSTPPLHELSDEDLLNVAVNQGLMQPDQAQQALQQRKAAQREPVAESFADVMQSSTGLPSILTKTLLTKGGKVGDIAAQVGGQTVGSLIGSAVPVLVAGTVAGGAAGAAAGDTLAQAREYFRGERDDFSKGEVIGSAVAGAIPLGNTNLTKPLVAIGKRALQGSGVAGVANTVQQVVDQQPFDWKQLAENMATGGLLGGAFGAAEVGAPKVGNLLARQKVLEQIRETPEFRGFKGTDDELTQAVRAKLGQQTGPAEPVNVTGTGDVPTTQQPFTESFANTQAAAAREKAPAPAPISEAPAGGAATTSAETPRPLSEMSDEELRALAKQTAPQATREEIPAHQQEVGAAAVNKGLLEQPPTRGAASLALQEKYPELTNIPENHTPIEIQRADGTIYPATISGYADEAGQFPWIGRLMDHGWTHGHLKPGESIVTPVPNPQQWSAGMHELPQAETSALPALSDGLKPLPEGSHVQYLGRKHLVMEGVGEPTNQWQVKMPGELGPGRTVTAEHLATEGFQAPQVDEPFSRLLERFGKKAALESAGQHLLNEAHNQGQTSDQIVDRFFSSTWKEMPSQARNKLGDWLASNIGLHGAGSELTPQSVREYFKPGRTLKNGDKVISYTPRAGEHMGVVEVQGEDGRVRRHTTKPTYKDALKELGSDKLAQTQGTPDKFWRAVNYSWPDAIKQSLGSNDLSELRGGERGVIALLLDAQGKFEKGAGAHTLASSSGSGALNTAEAGPSSTKSLPQGTIETHAMGGSISRGPRPPASYAPQIPAPVARGASAQPTQSNSAAAAVHTPPNDLVKDLQRVQRLVAPQTVDSSARFAANLLRELNSKMANEMARADHSLRQYRNSFDLTPVPKNWTYEAGKPLPRNYAFIDAYEGGRFHGLTTKEYEAAREFRNQNAALIDRVHALGTGALQTFYENYFPHIWDDPKHAQQVMAGILGKRPLEGGKSFLQKRTHELFTDGLAAGLKPVHDNPIDLWLLKKREVERYILGQNFVKEMKQAGLLKFVHAFSQKPEGYSTVNDRAFTVYGPPSVTVQEAFDAGMREKTLQALEALGVPHERVANLRGKQWGYEQNLKDTPGSEKIVTKFGGPDSVIWHELGHALDSRYPELRDTVMATPEMQKELRALADLRAEGEKVSASHQKYLRSTPEKMATILQAYLHAPERMAEVAPAVKKAFEGFLQSKPELSVIDEIRPTLRLGTGEMELPVGGMVKMGNWYMPDAAAQVMNNYLSPGLNTHLWYRSLREVSNLMNGAQLSLSGFHLGFTSLDAVVSRVALAIEDAYHKDFGKAVATAASAPLAPITNFIRGSKLRAAVLNAGDNVDPFLREIVRGLEAGGGRIGQDTFWQTQFTRRMVRSIAEAKQMFSTGEFKDGSLKTVGATMQAPFALLEQVSRPIHEYIVPRQKLGVFADLAGRAILQLGPNADPALVREVMRKAWDSTDNRMGQVTYDNSFYDRSVKDLSLLTFRAYGWQQGKFKEGGGAAFDTAKFIKNKAQGKSAEFTHRMAYVIALPLVVGIIGALLYKLYTGKDPHGVDYFQPKTGEIDANGNPVRLNLPSYMKDVISYSNHPGTSFGHSLNPMFSAMFDLLGNHDFYNVRIRNPDDPLWKQGSDVAKWAAGEFMPFSISASRQLQKNGSSVSKQVLPFFGFTPVPNRDTLTPAQELASEIMSLNMPASPIDRNKFDKSKYLKDVIDQIKTGHPDQGKKMLADGLDKGILDLNTTRLLMDHLKYSPLQFQVHHFTPEAAMRVFRIASPTEKEQLRGIIAVKVLNSKTMPAPQKGEYLKELESVIPAARAATLPGNN